MVAQIKFSGSPALSQTNYYLNKSSRILWIFSSWKITSFDLLSVRKKTPRRTQVFSFYIIGEMFKTNELFVDSYTLTSKFSFCVFIFSTEYAMTCHETKDNPRLVDLYPFLKHHNNSGIFSFLYIGFYWNNNLKLCFSLADTAVKNR